MDQRIRRVGPRPTKFRALSVLRTEMVSDSMREIVLGGEDIDGFLSEAPDDHVKVAFPQPGLDRPILPEVTNDGPRMPEGVERPPMRDYTPVFDVEAQELHLYFLLHGDGPAASWAQKADVGDVIGVGGPRGSLIVDPVFNWYLLIGDETAMPAIRERISALPQDARITAVIEVGGAGDQMTMPDHPGLDLVWFHRDGAPAGTTTSLSEYVSAFKLPDGDGFCFVACEKREAKAVASILQAKGVPEDLIKSTGYWTRED